MSKKLISLTLGIFLLLILLQNRLGAQSPPCPGAADIPPTQAWIHASTPVQFTVLGTSCTGVVDYCVRQLNGFPTTGETTYQSYLVSVVLDGCDDVDPTALFDAATNAVIDAQLGELNPAVFPPCTEELAVHHGWSYRPACWKKNGSGALVPCGFNPNDPAYCIFKCEVCHNNGQYYRFNCTYDELGTPTCSTEAPTPLSNWSANTCYHLHCGNHP
ncbi:MAG: hypothetical protein ABI778_07190 [Ignavibacteriota bacterium]